MSRRTKFIIALAAAAAIIFGWANSAWGETPPAAPVPADAPACAVPPAELGFPPGLHTGICKFGSTFAVMVHIIDDMSGEIGPPNVNIEVIMNDSSVYGGVYPDALRFGPNTTFATINGSEQVPPIPISAADMTAGDQVTFDPAIPITCSDPALLVGDVTTATCTFTLPNAPAVTVTATDDSVSLRAVVSVAGVARFTLGGDTLSSDLVRGGLDSTLRAWQPPALPPDAGMPPLTDGSTDPLLTEPPMAAFG